MKIRFKNISSRFIFSFTSVLIGIFIVLVVGFYVVFNISMNNYIKKTSYLMQEEIDKAVTEVVNESAYLYGRIMDSSNVDLLYKISDDALTKEQRNLYFNDLIQKVYVNLDYFSNVVILIDDYSFGVTQDIILPNYDYDYLKEYKNRLIYVGNVNTSIVMGIHSNSSVSNFECTMLFYLKENKIMEMCNPISGEEGYSFIMKNDGYIVSHIDKNLVGKVIVYSDVYNSTSSKEYKTEKLDSKKRIIVTSNSELLNDRYEFDSCIVSVLDYNYYFRNMELTFFIVLMISFVILVVAVIFAIFRARRISKPISLLSENINQTDELTLMHKKVLKPNDELAQLENNYENMITRIYDLVEKNKEDMLKQRKLELDSLQMQINPHFLYNTLDAISWMARLKGQPEIDRLVINLASFFRLFLHGGDKFVKVKDEINLVKNFLEIYEIRYPGKAKVHYEYDEDVLEIGTLKLILQPIVENSLKHAFTSKNGNLYIRAYQKEKVLYFEVEDDGDGFIVPDDLLTRETKMDGGYGLINVNERIRLQYGNEYGLTVTSTVNKGTLVVVKIKIM